MQNKENSLFKRKRLLIFLIIPLITVAAAVSIKAYNNKYVAQFKYLRSVKLPDDISVSYFQDSNQEFPNNFLCGLDAPCNTYNNATLDYGNSKPLPTVIDKVTEKLNEQGIKKVSSNLKQVEDYAGSESGINTTIEVPYYYYNVVYQVPKKVGLCNYLMLTTTHFQNYQITSKEYVPTDEEHPSMYLRCATSY